MPAFITFEGIDGCGKSTQVKRLAQHFPDCIVTREPGGSENAEAIRALLVSGDAHRWDAQTEVLLFTAARRDHVQTRIRPALAQGKMVICDRYIDSTRAYQATSEAKNLIEDLHQTFVALDPDITFWIDTPVDMAAKRIQSRDTQKTEDRFEKKGLDFQHTLQKRFATLAQQYPDRIKRIDGSLTQDAVFTQILSHL
jgi:dTMP kinase